MIDWNRSGRIDPVDIGIDIAAHSAESDQEIYTEKNFSDSIENSPLFNLFRELKKYISKKK